MKKQQTQVNFPYGQEDNESTPDQTTEAAEPSQKANAARNPLLRRRKMIAACVIVIAAILAGVIYAVWQHYTTPQFRDRPYNYPEGCTQGRVHVSSAANNTMNSSTIGVKMCTNSKNKAQFLVESQQNSSNLYGRAIFEVDLTTNKLLGITLDARQSTEVITMLAVVASGLTQDVRGFTFTRWAPHILQTGKQFGSYHNVTTATERTVILREQEDVLKSFEGSQVADGGNASIGLGVRWVMEGECSPIPPWSNAESPAHFLETERVKRLTSRELSELLAGGEGVGNESSPLHDSESGSNTSGIPHLTRRRGAGTLRNVIVSFPYSVEPLPVVMNVFGNKIEVDLYAEIAVMCPEYRSRNVPVIVNGCSVPLKESLKKIWPALRSAEVTKCCDNHDEAYSRCGPWTNKGAADDAFLQCIRKAGYPGSAAIFYQAVKHLGSSYYDAAQKKHCECVNPKSVVVYTVTERNNRNKVHFLKVFEGPSLPTWSRPFKTLSASKQTFRFLSLCIPTPFIVQLCFHVEGMSTLSFTATLSGVVLHAGLSATAMGTVNAVFVEAGVYIDITLASGTITVVLPPAKASIHVSLVMMKSTQGLFYRTIRCRCHWCCWCGCGWGARQNIGRPSSSRGMELVKKLL